MVQCWAVAVVFVNMTLMRDPSLKRTFLNVNENIEFLFIYALYPVPCIAKNSRYDLYNTVTILILVVIYIL